MCVFLSSVGGVGFALYSVREKLFRDGVLARGPSLCDGVYAGGVCGCGVPFKLLATAGSSVLLTGQEPVLSEVAIFTAIPLNRRLTMCVGVS